MNLLGNLDRAATAPILEKLQKERPLLPHGEKMSGEAASVLIERT